MDNNKNNTIPSTDNNNSETNQPNVRTIQLNNTSGDKEQIVIEQSNNQLNPNQSNSKENIEVFSLDDSIKDNNIENVDDKLLKAYIKNEKLNSDSFNGFGFFFGTSYLFYRKMYKFAIKTSVIYYGILLLCQLIYSGLIVSLRSTTIMKSSDFIFAIIQLIITLCLSFYIGLNFNKKYIEFSKKNIEKIKKENSSMAEDELVNICKKKGGSSFVGVLILLLIMLVFNVIKVLINNIDFQKNSNYTPEYSTNRDITNIKDYLSYTLPKEFKKTLDLSTTDSFQYKDNYNECNLYIKYEDNSDEEYDRDLDYIESTLPDFQHNKQNARVIPINNNLWIYYFESDSSTETIKHFYCIDEESIIYFIKYEILLDDGKCSNLKDEFVNSLSL